MEGMSDNVSYRHPRDPSTYLGRKFFEVGKTDLLSRFGDRQHVHASKDEKVKVYLRIKPTKDAAQMLAPPQDQTFQVKDSQTLALKSLKDRTLHELKFTKVFSGNASQEHVYNECVHNLVKDFINGQNCLLFAYGTSNAGKTYTIQGTSKEPGIIPRAINVLFNSIHGQQSETCRFKPDMVTRVVELEDKTVKQEIAYKQQIMAWSQNKCHVFDSKIPGTSFEKAPEYTSSSIDSRVVSGSFREMREQLNNSLLINTEGKGYVFSTWVSFAEIYNENLYDLLEPTGSGRQKGQNLALGVDSKGQVYIKGLKLVCVNSAEEAYHVMLYGQHNLKVAATGLNSLSSRSHCIFTIKLLQHVESEHPESVRISTFSFCDLAGAESAKKTHNVGERLKESQNINTSLLVLGRCLMTIRDNQLNKSENLVPFRESKLTRLFQRALTGKESLAMIVNVNPSPVLREETLNVLTFSAVAKQIISVPARHKKRVPRSSSFFQYVSKSSTLASNGTFEGDSATASHSNSSDNQHLHSQIEVLVNEIGELKRQLAVEQKSKLAKEIEVRREICEYFSNLRCREKADYESLIEDIKHQYEQMMDWKLKKLEDYYQNKQKRKRRCIEESSEDGNSTLEDSDAEVVSCLTEKLRVANELLGASQKDYNELLKGNSKLKFELSWCKTQVKNAEKLKEAAQAMCQGDQKCLITELESQLTTVKEELFKKDEKIQELNGILKDAVVDYKQLVDDLKATEKERDDLALKLAEKEIELRHRLDVLNEQQQVLDKQFDEKDERIEILEKQLKELQARYDGDMKTVKLRTQKLDTEQKTLLKDKQLLTSEAEELKSKLQESDEKLLQGEALQRVYQEEMQKSKCVIDDLQDKISALEEAEKNNIKDKINAQNCAEELRKHLEESTVMSQKEISELKTQLQMRMANDEFVRLLKEELKEKSHKCEQLESENKSLKRSLEVKEIEEARFKENRDQLLKTYENMLKKEREERERCKRDIQGYQQKLLKNTSPIKSQCEETSWKSNEDLAKKLKCCSVKETSWKSNEDLAKKLKCCSVKLHKLGDMQKACDETQATLSSESSQINRQTHWAHSHKKTADENTNPSSLGSLDVKPTSNTQSKTLGKTRTCNEKSKSRSRRKNLFPCNLDVSSEITPVETEIMYHLSPSRILRSRRM